MTPIQIDQLLLIVLSRRYIVVWLCRLDVSQVIRRVRVGWNAADEIERQGWRSSNVRELNGPRKVSD